MKRKTIAERMNDYREHISKMPLPCLKDEWEKARKILNPNCVEWQQKQEEPVELEINLPEEMKGAPKCKNCSECMQGKRSGGRIYYACTHSDVYKYMPDNLKANEGFICFAETGNTDKLTIKTSPRWCPLKFNGGILR